MKMFVSALLTLSAAICFANQPTYNLVDEDIHSVVVPTVWGTPSNGELVQGMLYYDGSTSSLKFIGNNATPVTIVSSGVTGVISGGSSERIERLRENCSSGSCSVISQSGSWVSSVTRNSIGNYTVNFASGIWASAPACSAFATNNTNNIVFAGSGSSSSGFNLATAASGSGAGVDTQFDLICMGPHP